jgi:NAD dependent epimerase/dehydratase family enzyme
VASGKHLIPTLKAKNHEVYKLVRKPTKSSDEIQWTRKRFLAKLSKLARKFDAIVHLAGDNVASENWSDQKKGKIKTAALSEREFWLTR